MIVSVNLLLTLLLTLRFSYSIKYTLTDVSKRTVCKFALRHAVDRTELEINVDTENTEGAAEKPFFMEFENQIYGLLRKTCVVYYKLECNNFNITEGCFCKSSQGNIYNIKYVSHARSIYSNNFVWINGWRQPKMKLPTITNDELTAVLRINKGKRMQTTKSKCQATVHLDLDSSASIWFCIQGLSNPTLTLSIPGQVDQSSTGDCLTIVHTFHHLRTSLTYKYTDLCGSSGEYVCDFEIMGGSATSGPLAPPDRDGFMTTTPEVKFFKLSADDIFTVIISQGFLVVIIAVIGIYVCYRKQKCCFKDDSDKQDNPGEE